MKSNVYVFVISSEGQVLLLVIKNMEIIDRQVNRPVSFFSIFKLKDTYVEICWDFFSFVHC